jgi:hypothetical protein
MRTSCWTPLVTGDRNDLNVGSRHSVVRAALGVARALVLAPLYYLLLTLFGLWPWHRGSPWFLLRPISIPGPARETFRLRTLEHRLLLRGQRLLRADLRRKLDFHRLRRWTGPPVFVTWRRCARFTRAEMRRTGLTGMSTAMAVYSDALVDSYRFANGTLHRDWFDLDRRGNAAYHLPNEHHIRVSCYLLNHVLNPDMPTDQRHFDKVAFYRICEAQGLPTIPTYAAFRDGKVTMQKPLPRAPLVSKPADMAEGNGLFARWEPAGSNEAGERCFKGEDGVRRTVTRLMEELAALSRGGAYLLQRRTYNHSEIRDLSDTDALCTLRIPTCCFADGRTEALPFAYFRFPTVSGIMVDNLARGAIAFPVDLESGRFKSGGMYGRTERFDTHPGSGRRITGLALPFFRESLELCRHAHGRAFSRYPTVGWDVAITADGPQLVEMNIQWLRPAGLPDEAFTGQSLYVDCILSHMRRLWPEQVG